MRVRYGQVLLNIGESFDNDSEISRMLVYYEIMLSVGMNGQADGQLSFTTPSFPPLWQHQGLAPVPYTVLHDPKSIHSRLRNISFIIVIELLKLQYCGQNGLP